MPSAMARPTRPLSVSSGAGAGAGSSPPGRGLVSTGGSGRMNRLGTCAPVSWERASALGRWSAWPPAGAAWACS
jgi:hypothetical protein